MRHARSVIPLSLLFTALAAVPAILPAAGAVEPETAPAPTLININTADVDGLQQIRGVGPALARRIVEYRAKHGPFRKIEELMNVRGIGEKTFLRFRNRITVGEPAAHRN